MMLYNRRSIAVFNVWVKHALLRGVLERASVGRFGTTWKRRHQRLYMK